MATRQRSKRSRRGAGERPGPAGRRRVPVWLLACVLIAAGAWSYSTSFAGGLMGDDQDAIATNPHIRSLVPLGFAMSAPSDTTLAGRPIPSLTFAINYALAGGQENLWGYHALNLAVHLLAGLALFGVVRRTLTSPPLVDRFGGASASLAFATALLWLVHPLQTESVTFLVQRVESLMGLFYLATIYCAIRAAESDFKNLAWTAAAVAVCALGMATKEVMVTAPVFVALWIWICRPDARLFGPPRVLLGGLAATWIIPCWVFSVTARSGSVGFGLGGWTAWLYLRTQAGVIVHYLRLVFWPHPLVFHYAWLPAGSWLDVWPQALLLGLLAVATLAAVIKRWPIGLAGAWFFLILAPTSSVLPIVSEVAAEHRMYLPLAAILALIVTGVYAGARAIARPPAMSGDWRRWALAGWTGLAVVAGLLAWRTIDRNRAYASVETMTADNVQGRPGNAQAQLTHAMHLVNAQRFAEAEAHLRVALALPLPLGTNETPRAMMHMYLGWALCSERRFPEGADELRQAAALDPRLDGVHVLLAEAELSLRRPREAVASLDQAIAITPDAPRPLTRAAWILSTSSDAAVRDGARAIQYGERAVKASEGRDPIALDALAAAYAEVGRFDQAEATIQNAIRLVGAQGGGLLPTLQNHRLLFEARRPVRTADW